MPRRKSRKTPAPQKPPTATRPGIAFSTTFYDSNRRLHLSAFALSLDAVVNPSSFEPRRIAWTQRLVHALVQPGGQYMLELRYLAAPGEHPLAAHLIGMCVDDGPEAAREAVLTLHANLQTILRMGEEVFVLTPVTSADRLAEILHPPMGPARASRPWMPAEC